MEGTVALLIPIFAVVLSLSIPIVALILLYKRNKLKTQERLAAIEKGIPIPPDPVSSKRYRDPIFDLRGGIICLSLGIGLLILWNFIGSFCQPGSDDFVGFSFISLAGGLVLAFIGLGKIIWYFVARNKFPKHPEEEDQELLETHIQ